MNSEDWLIDRSCRKASMQSEAQRNLWFGANKETHAEPLSMARSYGRRSGKCDGRSHSPRQINGLSAARGGGE
jgi:hypothetical protein